MRAIQITKNEAGQRLDKMLSKYLNLAGKSFIYKMMRKKNIWGTNVGPSMLIAYKNQKVGNKNAPI